MRRALNLHPDSVCAAVAGIAVEIARPRPGTLELHYIVTGSIADLLLPPVTEPARADELWRHTCFEAFVRVGSNPGYHEFNFAPSTRWAAYAFDGYRSGMRAATETGAPSIATESSSASFSLRASVDLGPIGEAPWQLALSAVIEEANGRKSWWALVHPPGKADFHHPDCFALQLPAA